MKEHEGALEGIGSLSRRSFVGAAVAAGATAVLGGLTACSSGSTAESEAAEGMAAGPFVPDAVAETLSCDLVVCGAGISGLTTAVQAAQNGLDVICLEKAVMTGGNGLGTEGLFAVDSPLQKQLGIVVKPSDVVRGELASSQWRSNGLAWIDLVGASGGNIEWLQSLGCQFSGKVDNYPVGKGGKVDVFHWWAEGNGGAGFAPYMTAAAEALGVTIMLETPAVSLVLEGGSVKGAYAKKADGSYIKVESGAVVCATGGFANNTAYLEELGFPVDEMTVFQVDATQGHTGDGIGMALEAGAADFKPNACYLYLNAFGTVPAVSALAQMVGLGGPFLWLNETAERFVDEGFFTENSMLQGIPGLNQEAVYALFSQAIFDMWTGGDPDLAAGLAEQVAGSQNVWTSDDIYALASMAGLDLDAFRTTVDAYNGFCDQGDDAQYGKDPVFLAKLAEGPFYLVKFTHAIVTTIGGLKTTRSFEVVDAARAVIPGLYAVGNDGNMLYRNVYTVDIPGSANGNNVNSGRIAANAAAAYIKA